MWNIWPAKVWLLKKAKKIGIAFLRSRSLNFAIAIVLRSIDEMAIADRDREKKIAIAINDQKIADQSCLGNITLWFQSSSRKYWLFQPPTSSVPWIEPPIPATISFSMLADRGIVSMSFLKTDLPFQRLKLWQINFKLFSKVCKCYSNQIKRFVKHTFLFQIRTWCNGELECG